MNLNKRNIFLIDGVGALVSAMFTGLILPLLSQWIGLPHWALYSLAVFPLIYGIYSLSCFGLVKTISPIMLKTIILANLFYCLVSGVVMFIFPEITIWGRLLLLGEILIVLGVVVIELIVYRNTVVSSRSKASV